MTKIETTKILATLSASYPQVYSKIPEQVQDRMIDLWSSLFKDDDYKLVGQAIKNYILNDTQGFLPPVGAIKEEIRRLMYPDEMTEQEAVNIIMAKLGAKSSNEAFDSLPPVLQKVVGSAGQLNTWGYMELDTVQSVISSNIQRSLRSLLEREREKQRTGQAQTYIKEQIETRSEPQKIPHVKTPEEKAEEQAQILNMLKMAKDKIEQGKNNLANNA